MGTPSGPGAVSSGLGKPLWWRSNCRTVIAAAALVDRSAGAVDLGVPFYPLIAINFPTYAPEELPPELAASEAVKPGSRAK